MKQLFLISTACAVLTACGGGSSSGSANGNTQNSEINSSVALTASNYDIAASEVLSSVSNFNLAATATQSLFTGAQVTTTISPASLLQEKLPELAQLVKKPAQVTGAEYTESLNCPNGGKIDVSANDNNNNSELDSGDKMALALDSCMYGSLKISGKMNLTVISLSEYSGFEISVEFSDFKSETNDFSSIGTGSFTMNASTSSVWATSVSITSPSMTYKVTRSGTSKNFQYENFSIVAKSSANTSVWTVNGKMSVPTLGANMASVNTTQQFSTYSSSGYPTAGEMMITVNNGGKMRVSATSTSKAKVELDLNSDGTYEEQKLIDWIDVL